MVQFPLVSIGLPTRNRPLGLAKILARLAQQQYSNLEIIVSDNHSSAPEVPAVLSAALAQDDRIRCLRQPRNIGQFENFRAVLAAAQGEYFCWVADDDDRDPSYITRCVAVLARSPQVLLVNSQSQLVDPTTQQLLRQDMGCTTLGLGPSQRYRRYLSTIFTAQAGVGDLIYGVMRRSAVLAAMPSQSVLPWDHLLLAKLALLGEFYTIPEPLMTSAAGGASRSNASAAEALLLVDSFAAHHPWWARELQLQAIVWDTTVLSLREKVQLSQWSYGHYLRAFGCTGIARHQLAPLHGLYRRWRYGPG